ncbi:MAG: hypothetical protein RL264_1220 [Bacteroidota bacterium]|jgi:Zn-dependent protease
MSDYSLYPEKPHIEKVKVESNWGLTAFSIVLFAGTFLLVFSDQLTFLLLLIVVLFVHEFGHYIAMKSFGYENVRMLFIPLMGAFVQGSKEKYSQKQSLIVSAAGPLPGIALGILFYYLSYQFQLNWMALLAFLFIFLNLVNLVPVDPLDGGQLFKLLVFQNQDLLLMIFSLTSSLSMIILDFFIQSWVLMGFGFLMAFKVRGMQVNYQMRKRLNAAGVKYISTFDELTNEEYAKLREVVIEETPALKKYLELAPENNEQLVASYVNSVLVAPVSRDASTIFRLILVIIWLTVLLTPFALYFFSDLHFVDLNLNWYFEQF